MSGKSMERDIEDAVIAILLADTSVATITTDFREWSDNSKARDGLQAMVKADKPEAHITGGDGKVWLWMCRVEVNPLSYIPDDQTLAVLDSLYKAVFNAFQGITAAALETAIGAAYRVFALTEDSGDRKNEDRVSIWTCSRNITIAYK